MGFTLSWGQWLRTDEDNFKRFQFMFKKFIRFSTVTTETADEFTITANANSDYTFTVNRVVQPGFSAGLMCKTNREPYTSDVCIGLVLMVEFGIAEELNVESEYLIEALETVQSQYPLKTYNSIRAMLGSASSSKTQ